MPLRYWLPALLASLALSDAGSSPRASERPDGPPARPEMRQVLRLSGDRLWVTGPDGTLWEWQRDLRATPLAAATESAAAREVSCGTRDCLIRDDAGQVWAWLLRDRRIPESSRPARVQGLARIEQVTSGARHHLAVDASGRVWAWGENASSQLGDGTNSDNRTPLAVAGLSDVVAVAAGGQHSLALRRDGSVWVFGGNASGQLGMGHTAGSSFAVEVPDLKNVVAIAAGDAHSLALDASGQVWAFGSNTHGQLWDTGAPRRDSPVRIPELSEVIAIAAGGASSAAMRADASVWVWGQAGFDRAIEGSRLLGRAPASSDPEIPYTADRPGVRVLLVIGDGDVQNADALVARVLTRAGYDVSLRSESEFRPEDAFGFDVLAVSASVEARDLPALAELPVPIVTWERFLTARLGLVNGARKTASGSAAASRITLSDAHPIARGLEGDLRLTRAPSFLAWGVPATGCAEVAALPEGTMAFACEADDSGAPAARRVALPIAETAVPWLTPEGWSLLEAAVAWAAAPPNRSAVEATHPVALLSPNLPPLVDAGPDQVVSSPTVMLTGSVSDDGLPNPPGAVTTSWSQVAGPGSAVLSDTGSVSTTVGLAASGTYVFRLTASDGEAYVSDEVTVTLGTGRSLIFVVGSLNPVPSGDLAAKGRMEQLGFSVVLEDDNGITEGMGGSVAVVISESTSAATIGTTFQDTRYPLISWEPDLFPFLNMTGNVLDTDFGNVTNQTQLLFAPSAHPLAAGLSDLVTVTTSQLPFAWGEPGPGGTVIARTADAAHPAIFAYESGATMVNQEVAPSRRVGFFMGANAPPVLTEDGWALFDAAIKWATEPVALALFVYNSTTTWNFLTLTPADVAIANRIASLGYSVEFRDDEDASASDADGKVLVVISDTVVGSTLGPSKFRDTATPVMVCRHNLFEDMKMVQTGNSGSSTSQTTVHISVQPSPLTAGLPPGEVTILTAPEMLGWGIPNTATAMQGAFEDVSLFPVSFGYEIGDAMKGLTAPNRRVGFGLGATAATALNATGWKLFDAAVTWAAEADPDSDGLTTPEELRLGSDPFDADSNDDGIGDGAAASAGLSLVNPDMDGDGLSNADELALGTDPFRWDTDGDGIGDAQDAFPLDPSRWDAPAPVPGDVTPPLVTLLEPTSATIVSILPPLPGNELPSQITSPTPGSTLASTTVTFQWTDVEADEYALSAGATLGGGEFYSASQGQSLSGQVSGLPGTATIYVRLASRFGTTWFHSDFTYQGPPGGPAVMISPPPGATLPATSQAFTWTGGASSYQLRVRKGLTTLFQQDTTGTLLTATGLPSDGSLLEVRLRSVFGSTTHNLFYPYTAMRAVWLVDPVPLSVLPSTTTTFQWTSSVTVDEYDLEVGTTGVGSKNIFDASTGTSTAQAVSGLPNDGHAVYVRLRWRIGTVWTYTDDLYSATSTAQVQMAAPTPGSTLTGSVATFSWSAGTNVTWYQLWVGSTGVGSSNLYDGPKDGQTSQQVSGLPTDGSLAYVRLRWKIGSTTYYSDYFYRASNGS